VTRGLIYSWDKIYKIPELAVELTQPPVEWVMGAPHPGNIMIGYEAVHLLPLYAFVAGTGNFTLIFTCNLNLIH
jgi:hypothetical protein